MVQTSTPISNTATFYATIGGAAKVIKTRLRDETGYVDLTGSTITFNALNRADAAGVITGTATADADQTTNKGLVAYTLTTANLDGSPAAAGTYDVEWKVVIGSVTTYWPDPGKDTLILQDKLA